VGFPEKNLNAGERIVLDLRPHWWFFARQATALVVTIAIGILCLIFFPTGVQVAAAVLILFALGWFGWHYLIWTNHIFVVTTDRLIDQSGVFTRQGIEIPLDRVTTVLFHQNLFERMIGTGDLVIESAAEQGAQPVEFIKDPVQVQNEIYRQMEANENRKYDRLGRNLTGGPGLSIADQIQQLAELRHQGALTDEEFQALKRDLLGGSGAAQA
jgi:membrane protein YdbS with pleckstrin-like domain